VWMGGLNKNISKKKIQTHPPYPLRQLISCGIDTQEGQYVVVTDLLGAFLHMDMEQDNQMHLKGTIAALIVKLEPILYRKFIWRNRQGKPMLNVKLKRALYRMLQVALIFLRLLLDTLI